MRRTNTPTKGQITYLNGPRLARAALAGANAVAINRENLDAINVFPVADGDTGTNLMATLRAIAAAAHHVRAKSVAAVGRALADAAVDGARGNSGAIMASFYSGFADGLAGHDQVDGAGLADAAEAAARSARESVAEPREGTILTVASRWAAGLRRAVERDGHHDIYPVLSAGLAEAQQALAETQGQMELLSKAGVVDAGARGFVDMLEGIDRLLDRRGALAEMREAMADLPPAPHLEEGGADIRFRFCTEVLLEGTALDRIAVRDAVARFGDSLVVAGGRTRLRVHVHTDTPEEVFSTARLHGIVSFTKADDMKAQNAMAFAGSASEGIVITSDSTCDMPESEVGTLDRIPLIVRFGPEEFLDGVTLRPEEFIHKLASSTHFPTTSQASVGDFRRAFERHLRRGATVVSIHLSAALSGTHQSALRAAQSLDPTRIRVVDSRSASVGLLLVVGEARRVIAAGGSVEEVVAAAESAARRVRVYCTLSTLKYLARGGRLDVRRARIGEFLRIRPILCISGADGKASEAGKGFGFSRARAKMLQMLEKDGAGRPGARVAITHCGVPRAAAHLADELAARFGIDRTAIPICACAPVLAAHAGPGALAAAVLPPA